jgi:hypothetical protein
MYCDIGKQGREKYVIRTNKMHTSYINDLTNYSLLILLLLLLIFYELNNLYLDNSYSIYYNVSTTEIP